VIATAARATCKHMHNIQSQWAHVLVEQVKFFCKQSLRSGSCCRHVKKQALLDGMPADTPCRAEGGHAGQPGTSAAHL
jgi:hypothetical protein